MNAASPPFSRNWRLIEDPDQFVDAVSGASLCVDLRRRMAGPARIDQFQGWDWALDFSVVHVDARVRGEIPRGWATAALIRSDKGSRWAGREVRPGTLLVNPPGVDIDGSVTPGFGWTTLSVSPGLWAEAGRVSGIEGNGPRSLAIHDLPPAVHSTFEGRLRRLHALLRTSDVEGRARAAREARDAARDLAALAWELGGSARCLPKPLPNRYRIARRAEDWMRDHLSEPVGIPDLCLGLRIGRRELEYAFRATFDASPWDFFQKLRLNAVYRELRRFPFDQLGGVTEVALKHGVGHLGRFSTNYRELFGEYPNETLRRRLSPDA